MNKFTLIIFLLFLTSYISYSQFSGGSGTKSDPYKIKTKADIEELANLVGNSTTDTNWSMGKHFSLMNDIKDSVRTMIGGGKNNRSSFKNKYPDHWLFYYGFCGFFHGNGYTITLAIDVNVEKVSAGSDKFFFYPESIGLFSLLDKSAVVDSLTIDGYINVNFIPTEKNNYSFRGVAGIAGLSFASISHCINKANITSNISITPLGGIVGCNECHSDGSKVDYYGKISNCINKGNLTYIFNDSLQEKNNIKSGISGLGGIAGSNGGDINNCENYGNFNIKIGNRGTLDNIGGIVGINGYSLMVALSTPTISNCTNYANIKAVRFVGGIAGSSTGSITYCVNKGNIAADLTTDTVSAGIGGIAGKISGYSKKYHTTANCLNIGNVSGANYVGGVVGSTTMPKSNLHDTAKSANIDCCLNTGEITGETYIGGIVAQSYFVISNCVNIGKVIGKNSTGGIVSEGTVVYNCINSGLVQGANSVAGIAAIVSKQIEECINTASVYGRNFIAGIVSETVDTAIYRNCFYDKQLCVYGGLAGTDYDNKTEGKLTKNMIGDKLKPVLNSNNWEYHHNMYPRLKILKDDTVNLVAAAPVAFFCDTNNLADYDIYNKIKRQFIVATDNNVKWSSFYGKIKIYGVKGAIIKTGEDTLYASIDKYKKIIPIYILPDADTTTYYDVTFTVSSDIHELISPATLNYTLPITINSSMNFKKNSLSIEKIIIEINSSIFYPKLVDNGTMSLNYIDSICQITIANPTIPELKEDQPVVLLNIVGDMLLGNVDSTAISIKEANILPPYNFNSTIKRVNGYITNSICNEGSKRLINVSKHSPNLILINNIVGEILDVECTVIESGNYNLEIIDLLGNTTIIKEWTTDSTKDKFNFSIPIKNLDNGNYFVVMRTPTMRINKKFIIKR